MRVKGQGSRIQGFKKDEGLKNRLLKQSKEVFFDGDRDGV